MDHMGPGAGKPELEWPGAPDWPDKDPAAMDDGEVLAYARLVYARFRVVPRWHAENDELLRRWAAVCAQMARRGMTDTVTEGGRGGDVVELARKTEGKQ